MRFAPPATMPSCPGAIQCGHPASDVRLTYDDFLQFPDDGKRHELIDGEHFVTPSPNTKHQTIAGNLHGLIWTYLRQQPVGRVFVAPFDVVFSDFDVVEPDLLFVSKARQADVLTAKHVRGAPDLVVEIGSPGTRKRDETIKRRLYERFGVGEYWVVDPELDEIKVYRLADGRFARVAELALERDETLESPLFPGRWPSGSRTSSRSEARARGAHQLGRLREAIAPRLGLPNTAGACGIAAPSCRGSEAPKCTPPAPFITAWPKPKRAAARRRHLEHVTARGRAPRGSASGTSASMSTSQPSKRALGEAAGLERLLDGEAVVDDVRHELRVRLALVPAAHDAEADLVVALLHEGRDDGVQRALARRQRVRLVLAQREQAAAVLQHEAGARRHQSRAEAAVVALDERHDVAVLVDDRHVDRVVALRVGDAGQPIRQHLARRLVGNDQLGALDGAGLVEHRRGRASA